MIGAGQPATARAGRLTVATGHAVAARRLAEAAARLVAITRRLAEAAAGLALSRLGSVPRLAAVYGLTLLGIASVRRVAGLAIARPLISGSRVRESGRRIANGLGERCRLALLWLALAGLGPTWTGCRLRLTGPDSSGCA